MKNKQPAITSYDKLRIETATNDLPNLSRRIIADIIDFALVLAVLAPVQVVIFNWFASLSWIVDDIRSTLLAVLLYFLFNLYLLLAHGQTIGKAAMHLRIVDSADGTRLPPRRLIVFRYFWIFGLLLATSSLSRNARDPLTTAIIGIDYLWMLRDGNQRCLHDYLAGSRVVNLKKTSFTPGST